MDNTLVPDLANNGLCLNKPLQFKRNESFNSVNKHRKNSKYLVNELVETLNDKETLSSKNSEGKARK